MAGTISAKRKLVFLDVILPETEYPLEFSIQNPEESGKTDLQVVVDVASRKKPCLQNWFKQNNFNFLKESEVRPGKWVSFGEDSPLKEENNMKCVFKLNLNFENAASEPSSASIRGNKRKR
jgi:hypothetical protein